MSDSTTPSQLKVTHATPHKYSQLKPNAKRPGIATSQDLNSRLISILPSSSYSDPVHCLIKPVNLADLDFGSEDEEGASSYDAVSYVWGVASLTHTLYCDNPNSHLLITKRLYNILLQLREDQRQRRSKRLWIDAICINQGDLLERSSQVQFMTHIYRRAARTHVFLGEGVGSWLESEWFSRRWVIQEFVVSNEVVIHHGFTSIGNPNSAQRHCTWGCLMRDFQNYGRKDVENPAHISAVLELDEFRQQGSTFSGIFTLLLEFEKSKCGDERDRLFSLVGIANNVSLRATDGTARIGTRMDGNHKGIIDFSADYRMSTQEVYTAFAQAALKTIAPFEILHCAGAFRTITPASLTTSGPAWPTWVPDWRLPLLCKPLFKNSVFDAGLNVFGKKRAIDVTDSAITIAGARLTKVHNIKKALALVNPEITDIAQLAQTVHHFEKKQLTSYLRDTGRSEFIEPADTHMRFDRVSIETSDGRRGHAPLNVLLGDDIVIFYGARTPFLLRRVSGQDFFHLVGDLYLDGVMSSQGLSHYSPLKDEKFTIV
jgi:hypothetical protein